MHSLLQDIKYHKRDSNKKKKNSKKSISKSNGEKRDLALPDKVETILSWKHRVSLVFLKIHIMKHIMFKKQ